MTFHSSTGTCRGGDGSASDREGARIPKVTPHAARGHDHSMMQAEWQRSDKRLAHLFTLPEERSLEALVACAFSAHIEFWRVKINTNEYLQAIVVMGMSSIGASIDFFMDV